MAPSIIRGTPLGELFFGPYIAYSAYLLVRV